jgi:hypothetical protein
MWRVHSIRATGDAWYPWRVEGVNVESGESFCWSVPDLVDPRYDLSMIPPADLLALGVR